MDIPMDLFLWTDSYAHLLEKGIGGCFRMLWAAFQKVRRKPPRSVDFAQGYYELQLFLGEMGMPKTQIRDRERV